jgi:hypothetical protein
MNCRVIKKQWHRFIYGLDHHNGLYWQNFWNGLAPLGLPPAPIPPGLAPAIPESLHGVQYAATDWFSMDDKSHANILADGSPVFSRNHTIKRTPHCPPGVNIAVISTIAFSTSTFKLGVNSVQANTMALASTYDGPLFVTVQCGDPASIPSGWGIAPGTVHISPTLDDFEQALIEWYMGAQVEIATSFVFGKVAGPVFERVARRLSGLGRFAPKAWTSKAAQEVERQAAREAAQKAAEKTVRENGYDAFVSNEARRQGLNPSKLDDASKKAIDAAFEKEVKEVGERAAREAGGDAAGEGAKGSGPAAKEATESWFEGQRKGSDAYSAPPNTQASPAKAHGSRAEAEAKRLEQQAGADRRAGYGKVPEAPAGDGAKWVAGDKTGSEIEDAAQDWSGVPEGSAP